MATRSGCNPGCASGTGGTCEEILEGCIQPALLPPLFYNPDTQQIGLCISDLEGNGLSRDGNGCLYSDSSGTPPPPLGRKTIAALPAFFFGSHSCAALMHPFGSPKGVETSIGNGIDWVDSWSTASADGVAIWTPYADSQAVDVYTTSPSTGSITALTAAEATGLLSDAGNPYTPVSQRSGAPASEDPTGRDVNWWGWSAAPWYLQTTAEQLEDINARIVVNLRCNSAADVAASISAVATARAQTWCMITVLPGLISQVATITAAGMVACVNLDADTTTTPATVTGSGATWVMIRYDQTDARINSFSAAGLNVVVISDSTHYQTNRARNTLTGIRGVTCHNPVYARGQLGTTAALAYRKTNQLWSGKGPKHGQLTRKTSQFSVTDGRGYTTNTVAGRVSEIEYQWDNSSTPKAYAQTLLGEMMPIATPTAYTIEWDINIRNSQPTQNFCKSGIFCCFADDRDFATNTPTTSQTGINGYHAFIRCGSGSQEGLLVIGKITDGLYTQLATSSTQQGIGADVPFRMRLTVTATTVQLTRLTGTPYSVSVTDSAYRGAYAKESKEETTGGGGTFEVATDNWVYAP